MAERPAQELIGLGVLWNRSRANTWSHTPLSLLHGLESTGVVADLGYDDSFRRTLHIIRHLRRVDRRLSSTWRYKESVLDAARDAIALRAESDAVDVILTVGDIGTFDAPFYVYQDLSYDLLEREIDKGNEYAAQQFALLGAGDRERLRERQHKIFAEASGILAMSGWYAESLVQDSGIDSRRVHVVHPGATAVGVAPLEISRRLDSALFVGRDFYRKGGDLVVAAVEQVRRNGPDISLTVVGPSAWPMPTPLPEWVNFLGPQPPSRVAELMATHSVFVLPSRFEAFGIVFIEALRAGIPVVGPRDFAVPEIVSDGRDGALFTNHAPAEVADAIDRALTDSIREQAFDSAGASRDQTSWAQTASAARAAIGLRLS